MRRLAIHDLEGGNQPIWSDTKDCVIVCNGEIYNFRELRQELHRLGQHFHTESDTEVALRAYETWGVGALRRLKGMFALAIIDTKLNALLIARDTWGEKPLYFWQGANQFLFASELKPLARAVDSRELTDFALGSYLSLQYVVDPSSPFGDIRQVPAGHYVWVDAQGNAGAPASFAADSAFANDPRMDEAPTLEEAARNVQRLFEHACARMLDADVPVGISLSGGIDSAIVAATCARIDRVPLRAFTVGYQGNVATDERPVARAVADELSLRLLEIEVSAEDVVSSFDDLVHSMDQPIADIAAAGYRAVSAAARRSGVPVLLSGIGGDEQFWGYDWIRRRAGHREATSAHLLRHQMAASGLSKVAWRARRNTLFGSNPDVLRGLRTYARLRAESGPAAFELSEVESQSKSSDPMDTLETQNRLWLRSNCLALADSMSMCESVELRLPFLDADLTNYLQIARVHGLRDYELRSKTLLRLAFAHSLPAVVTQRPKQGFTPPSSEWMLRVTQRYESSLRDGWLEGQPIISAQALHQTYRHADLFTRYKLVLLERWGRTTA